MRPWKSEYYKSAYAEISLWTIRRYQSKNYYIKCFCNYYNDITEDIERKKRLAFPYHFIMFASIIFPELFLHLPPFHCWSDSFSSGMFVFKKCCSHVFFDRCYN